MNGLMTQFLMGGIQEDGTFSSWERIGVRAAEQELPE